MARGSQHPGVFIMRFVRVLAVLALVAAPALADDKEKGDKKVAPALNFKMKDIDGKDVELSKLQGKVVMFVNVASKCGLTPQYESLQALHDKYAKDGLAAAQKQKNRDLEGHFKELMDAAQRK